MKIGDLADLIKKYIVCDIEHVSINGFICDLPSYYHEEWLPDKRTFSHWIQFALTDNSDEYRISFSMNNNSDKSELTIMFKYQLYTEHNGSVQVFVDTNEIKIDINEIEKAMKQLIMEHKLRK